MMDDLISVYFWKFSLKVPFTTVIHYSRAFKGMLSMATYDNK